MVNLKYMISRKLLFWNGVSLSLSKAGYMRVLRVRQAHPDIFLKLIDCLKSELIIAIMIICVPPSKKIIIILITGVVNCAHILIFATL